MTFLDLLFQRGFLVVDILNDFRWTRNLTYYDLIVKSFPVFHWTSVEDENEERSDLEPPVDLIVICV